MHFLGRTGSSSKLNSMPSSRRLILGNGAPAFCFLSVCVPSRALPGSVSSLLSVISSELSTVTGFVVPAAKRFGGTALFAR